MKKYLLVLFVSILFVFNGRAQCNIDGGAIYTQSQMVCIGQSIMIFNSALPNNISPNVTYEWLFNGIPIQGQNQAMQCVFIVTQNGTVNIVRKVKDLNTSCIAQSNFIPFNVYLPFFQGSILGNDTICNGSLSTAINPSTLPTGGDGIYYYQWQKSENNGGTWTTISGATNTTYAPGILTTTTQYRRSDGSGCGYSLNGNQITKTVMNCGTFSTNITGAVSISPNQTASYSVPASVGMQYVWTVTGGTITSGQGTNSIDVTWDGGGSANLRTTVANYSVSVVETDATPASKTTTQPIATITTGINKGLGSTGISVFPNPIKNQFTIEIPTTNTSVNYTVYSTTGVQMQSGSFSSAASGNTISTQLPAGMYQLVLDYDGVFTSTRLVVSGQ